MKKPSQNQVDEVIRLFKRVHRAHRKAFDKHISSIGIGRGQHLILMRLHRASAALSQRSLADMLDVSPAATTVMLKKMERDGLITRRVSKTDGRFNDIVITDKGSQIAQSSDKEFTGTDMLMFEGLTSEELSIFSECLEKMRENLDRINTESAVMKGR